jgi:hypothetical protein
LLPALRRVVVAVCDDQPRGKLDDFWEHGELVSVGWSHRKTSDYPWPADPYVHTEAIEGLLEEDVLAESGFSFEARAAVGAGEQACRQGHRVTNCEGGIVRSLGQELLPEELLGLPQVRCLPGEGGAMHTSEVREEVGVVAPEVRKEFCIFIESQELTDDLDGEHFRVAQRGSWSAPSETPEVLESVIYEAEDGYDEGAKIHKKKTSVTFGAIGSTPSVHGGLLCCSSPQLNLHMGLTNHYILISTRD